MSTRDDLALAYFPNASSLPKSKYKFWSHAPISTQSCNMCFIRMTNIVDPDQPASLEAG